MWTVLQRLGNGNRRDSKFAYDLSCDQAERRTGAIGLLAIRTYQPETIILAAYVRQPVGPKRLLGLDFSLVHPPVQPMSVRYASRPAPSILSKGGDERQ